MRPSSFFLLLFFFFAVILLRSPGHPTIEILRNPLQRRSSAARLTRSGKAYLQLASLNLRILALSK